MRQAVRLDRHKRFRFLPLTSPEADQALGHMSWKQRMASVHLVRPGAAMLSGAQAILESLALLAPLVRPAVGLYRLLPGSGPLAERAYRWVAAHRKNLGCRIDHPH